MTLGEIQTSNNRVIEKKQPKLKSERERVSTSSSKCAMHWFLPFGG